MRAFAGDHADLHNSGMQYSAVLKEIMRVGDLTQSALARRLKVQQPTVSRLLKGAEPKGPLHERIVREATRLGVIGDQPVQAQEAATGGRARVVGYVGAGATAHYYALPADELDTVPAPEGATPETVAVEIRGSSLGPMFDRWLAFYDDVRRPATDDLIGKLCVIGLSDERVLIKRLEKGRRAGLYRLASNTEPPIEDVPIEWAARVKGMVPR